MPTISSSIYNPREGERYSWFRRRFAATMLCAIAVQAPAALHAQARSPTDRSLTASLLAVSIPGPVAPFTAGADSGAAAQATHFEIDYGRVMPGDLIGGDHQVVVLGVRSESQATDRDGVRVRGSGVVGARLGLRAGDRGDAQAISAWEVYFGGRNLITSAKPEWLDAGLEVAVGWGNLGLGQRASLGFRAPIELVHEVRQARATVFLVPGMAWGHIRTRSCEDNGPGDNCGDLGVQLAAGRTRFLLGGGAGVTLLPSRLSIVAGVQRLFAVGEETRLWMGVAWTQ